MAVEEERASCQYWSQLFDWADTDSAASNHRAHPLQKRLDYRCGVELISQLRAEAAATAARAG
jgi:hypothetical protein